MQLDWVASAMVSATGNWKACVHNAILLLQNDEHTQHRIRLNAFNNLIEVRAPAHQPWPRRLDLATPWRALEDTDITRLRAMFDGQAQFTKEAIFDAVAEVANRATVHPVKAYLTGLEWDGTPRIDALFPSYFGAEDSPLHRAVGAKFLIGAVARIMVPGCKLDTMPVLEGRQGLFKSSALATLVPNRQWFSDTFFDINSKDAYLALHGVWIYEIGEMESFSRAEATRLKGFLSSSEDKFRVPYGRTTRSFPRQSVFVGTTNDKDYVTDATGERRKWPIPVRKVDLVALAQDRDQLWAEARVRFEAGERWYLEGEAAAAMSEVAMERHVQDPLVDGVDEAIRRDLTKRLAKPEHYTNKEVRNLLLMNSDSMSVIEAKRLARALRALGFEQTRRPVGGITTRVWLVPEGLWAEVEAVRAKVART